MRRFLLSLAVLTSLVAVADTRSIATLQGELRVLERPSTNGHADFILGIDSAKQSIEMENYHLTDLAVAQSLANAQGRGVKVRLILDAHALTGATAQAALKILSDGGVVVQPSSPAFSITHSKVMVVDREVGYVTTINLTRTTKDTRDLGVVFEDKQVIEDIETIFEADWKNANTKGMETPEVKSNALVISPVNSRQKLVELITSAQKAIATTVENLGDMAIRDALAETARRGISVRLILPMCDLNSDPLHNYPDSQILASAGVQIHVMPSPSSPTQPYIHSKMMVVDGTDLYIGSVNFSFNSTQKAREIGLIFRDIGFGREVLKTFETDWSASVPLPATPPTTCRALPNALGPTASF